MRIALLLAPVLVLSQDTRPGLKCYSNGDGVGVPSAEAERVTCQQGEWCVAKNYYGDLGAATWPLDARGEKCYRYCQKMDIVTATTEQEFKDNRWDEDYQDDEQTKRQYFQDTGIHLTMTCYTDLCNEFCLDDDAALATGPGMLLAIGAITISLAFNHLLST
jgi:hypothetical protein